MDEKLTRARYRAAITTALETWHGAPAQWGRDDCALVIADIDVAVLGIDPAAPFRGYASAREAMKLLGDDGVLGTITRVAAAMKWRAIAAHQAQDGDRAIAVAAGGDTCVIRFAGFWVGRFDRGNILATDSQILRAWSVL